MEKLMSLTMKATAPALLTLALSCNLEERGSAPPGPIPGESGNTEGTPATEPVSEELAPEASAETLAAESALRARLSELLPAVAGANVAFIDCTRPPCSARLVAPSRAALRDLLQAVSQNYQGRIDFAARERLDAYLGRTFEADVIVDTDDAREVPSDEEELLTNNPE